MLGGNFVRSCCRMDTLRHLLPLLVIQHDADLVLWDDHSAGLLALGFSASLLLMSDLAQAF